MKPDEIYRRVGQLREAGKTVTYDRVPSFDQLTEYVYEDGLTESAGGARVRLAVGKVVPDEPGHAAVFGPLPVDAAPRIEE